MIFPIRVVPLLFLCAFALFSGAVVHESRHFMYNVDLMLLHVEIFRVSLRSYRTTLVRHPRSNGTNTSHKTIWSWKINYQSISTSRLYLRSTLKSFVHTPHTQSICNKTAICCLLPDGLFRMPSVFSQTDISSIGQISAWTARSGNNNHRHAILWALLMMSQ